MNRIIALVDMDCFYVQVEQRLNPDLKGKPVGVVQYNPYRGGGLIAVGYEARACGVKRGMRGDDAKKLCPDLQLAQVPQIRNKANLARYREAGAEVIDVLKQHCECVERASIDEAFLDLTEVVTERMRTISVTPDMSERLINTSVVGFAAGEEGACPLRTWLALIGGDSISVDDQRLAVGALLVSEMRAAVLQHTGFTCSAGVAHNKVLAKLAGGMNKPNKQTILPHSSVSGLFDSLPIKKLRHLGGKFGENLQNDLCVEYVIELTKFSLNALQQYCGEKNGTWLYDLVRGREFGAVTDRQITKSIGCSKNFLGPEKLDTKDKVRRWLGELADELEERLTEDQRQNRRKARHLSVGIRMNTTPASYSSRSGALSSCSGVRIAAQAYQLLEKFNTAPSSSPAWVPAALNLHLSVGKFEDLDESNTSIVSFFSGSHDATDPFSSDQTKSSSTKSTSANKNTGIENFLSTNQSNNSTIGSKDAFFSGESATSKKLSSKSGFFSRVVSDSEKLTSVELCSVPESTAGCSESSSALDDDNPNSVNIESSESYQNSVSHSRSTSDSSYKENIDNNDRNNGEAGKKVKSKPFFERYVEKRDLWEVDSNEGQELNDGRSRDKPDRGVKHLTKSSSFFSAYMEKKCDEASSLSEFSLMEFKDLNKNHELRNSVPMIEPVIVIDDKSRDDYYSDSEVKHFDQKIIDDLPVDIRNEIEQFRQSVKKPKIEKPKGLLGFMTRKSSKNVDSNDPCSSSDMSHSSVVIGSAECSLKSESRICDVKNPSFGDNSEMDDDITRCDQCGLWISVYDVTEHSDYHLALQLSNKTSPRPPSGAKRKHEADSSAGSRKTKSSKISQFFQPKGS